MSDGSRDEQLESDVRELLDRAADPESPPPEARERVRSRLEESIGTELPTEDDDPGAESGEGDSGVESGEAPSGEDEMGGEGTMEAGSAPSAGPGTGGGGGVSASTAGSTAAGSAAAGAEGVLFGSAALQTAVGFLLGVGVGAGGVVAIQSARHVESRREAPAAARRDAGLDAGRRNDATTRRRKIDADSMEGARTDAAGDTRPALESEGERSRDSGLHTEKGTFDPSEQRSGPSARAETSEREPSPAPDPHDAGGASPSIDASERRPEVRASTDIGGSTLSEERLLLKRAHSALTRGRPERALRALDRHRRRFPEGQLTEERRAIRIKALVRAGRKREAAQRAEAFVKDHPHSIFRGLVEPALKVDRPSNPDDSGSEGP